MPTLIERPAIVTTSRATWLGDRVTSISGPLPAVVEHIPTFRRVAFGSNPHLDVIMRGADAKTPRSIPLNTVSKAYKLVQHLTVIEALVNALTQAGIGATRLRCRVTLSALGARMVLRIHLPERLAFVAPDGHRMALTFECFNSVDRSVPFFAVLGWFRFVCSNGLVIGETQARMRNQHRPSLRIEDLEPMLTEGLEDAVRDREALLGQNDNKIEARQFEAWVDGPLAAEWGPFAACRVHAIVTRGVDGEPERTPWFVPPHQRQLRNVIDVPGACAPCRNAYGISQALAWVAARRSEVAERYAWRSQIPQLITAL